MCRRAGGQARKEGELPFSPHPSDHNADDMQNNLEHTDKGDILEGISSSELRLLYDPILTSVHDYWENHSFDCMDFCQQNDVSAF